MKQMKQRLVVAVALALALSAFAGTGVTAAASPAQVTESAAAVWTWTERCVETSISVSGAQLRTAAGDVIAPARAAINLSQHEYCTNPLSPLPVLSLSGITQTDVALEVRGDLRAGRLTATMPVTCYEYVAGSWVRCAVAPFNADTVSVALTWASNGYLTQYCYGDYRYGQATGSIQLGDANLLKLEGGGVVRSDLTETNLGRTFPVVCSIDD